MFKDGETCTTARPYYVYPFIVEEAAHQRDSSAIDLGHEVEFRKPSDMRC